MPQTFQVKRSTGSAAPPTLARGELSYSHGSMTFYIGDPTADNTPVPIGGAIINNAGAPILASGVTAGEIRTLIGVDASGVDNSTPVSLSGAYDYITLAGQVLTLNQIDATTDISGLATIATSGNLSDAAGDTDDVTEGTVNRYYSDTLARGAFSGGTGVTINGSGVISIGQNVGTGASPTFSELTLTGDLNVGGAINSTSTTELLVEDNAIYLNSTYTGSSPTLDATFEVERGTVNNARIIWDETSNEWQIDNGTGTGSAIVTSATQGGVTSVSTNAGLGSLSSQAGSVNVNLDLSELTDMTAAVNGAQDELILLDNGNQRRKQINEIALSSFNNDLPPAYSHPTFNGDDIDVDTGTLSGATVIESLDFNVTTNGEGHVTDANAVYTTRNLTPGNIGAATAAQGAAAATALQSITLTSTDGSITGVGVSSGTTPSFDLEVGVIDGGTY